jgi:hypothetical protein
MFLKPTPSFYSFLAVFLTASAAVFAQAAPTFASLKLERIHAALPRQCVSANANGMICGEISSEKLLYIRKNRQGEISQIGVRLFPEAYHKLFAPEALDFLECTALEMLLLGNNNQRISAKFKEYRMSWLYGGSRLGEGFFPSFAASLKAITDSSAFRLFKDSLLYTAQWTHPLHGTTSVSFPAQYSLISGKDNKELGDELGRILSVFQKPEGRSDNTRTEAVADESLLQHSGAVYLKRGQSFIIPEINSDIYYQKSDARSYQPLYSRLYQHETLANLFIRSDMPDKRVMLDITHRKYGYTEEKYRVKLSDFVAFFGEKFETYVGFELANHPDIKAVVILYNRDFNYVNMLLVDAVENIFFEDNSNIKCRMYAFIPSHNIKNLFGGSNIQNTNHKEYEPLIFE